MHDDDKLLESFSGREMESIDPILRTDYEQKFEGLHYLAVYGDEARRLIRRL